MKVEYVEESSVKKALAFEVDAETLNKEIARHAKEYAKKARIPGFRPGRIPPEVIKKRYHQQVLQDAVEAIVNEVVPKELEDRGLRPLAMPKIQDVDVAEDKPLTFKAVFETLPIVELPEYQGMPVKARRPAVSEEDVDKDVDRLREEAARFDPVEGRPARDGDFVAVDLSWRPQSGRGGRNEDALIEVGADSNHADINKALIGVSPGDHRELTVSYDDKHPSLPGQTVTYNLTVKGIKDKVVPAADDEFAKDLGEFDDLAALRGRLRQQLEAVEQGRIDREVKAALVDVLVGRASFEVPEVLVERHMDARIENAARSLVMQGVDPTKAGVDWARFREAQRDDCVRAAKADILLDEIARREKVEVTEGEVDAEVARYAARVRKPVEVVRARLEKDGEIGQIAARIREDKTLEVLKASARMEAE